MPTILPLYFAPCACAASSTSGNLCFLQIARTGSRSNGLAVQMHRHDGPGAWCDGAFDEFRIKIERGVVNIHIDRFGADVGNRPTGGHECERRGDDFITGANSQQHHGHMQRRSAAVETDAMVRTSIFGKVLLKMRHVRSKTEGTVVECAGDGGIEVFPEAAESCAGKSNRGSGSSESAPDSNLNNQHKFASNMPLPGEQREQFVSAANFYDRIITNSAVHLRQNQSGMKPKMPKEQNQPPPKRNPSPAAKNQGKRNHQSTGNQSEV